MEVIVIVGVLLVVAMAAILATQGGLVLQSPVPSGVRSDQELVVKSVDDLIKDSADETLRIMMMHGGYLEDDSIGVKTYKDIESTDFLLTEVAYWQRCENTMYPGLQDVESWMAASIKSMLEEGIDEVESSYNNIVTFDEGAIDVKVKVFGANTENAMITEPNKIDITVMMPTKVKGQDSAGDIRDYGLASDLYPYKVTVDTKFGRIYAFGRDFADAASTKRFFDVFSIVAIMFSQELDMYPRLPTTGVMTDCGEMIYRSSTDINKYLFEILEYVMVATSWWEKMDNQGPDTPRFDEPKSFAIQDLNGKIYDDLDVRTMITDDWKFNVFDMVLETNFDMPRKGPFVIPVCTASYNHAYEFNYPFILRVRDPYTGYSFNIASEVAVRNRGDDVMEPGVCGSQTSSDVECQNLTCSGRVRVIDESGSPISNVDVIYGGCPLAKTDGDGISQGMIKCGTNTLNVFRDRKHEFFERSVASDVLANTYTVKLGNVNEIKIHFREVEIKRTGIYVGADGVGGNRICNACPRYCELTAELSYECNIGLVERETVNMYFDNGYISYPASNIDISSVPDECGNTEECKFCHENSELAKSMNATERKIVFDACSACIKSCPTEVVESITVDYIPSGYTYEVTADMRDPLGIHEYFPNGVLDDTYTLGKDDTEIYVYIPKRSGDRTGWRDYEIKDSEKTCLIQALDRCGIDAITSEDYLIKTVVLQHTEDVCSELKSLAVSCGAADVDSYFYNCPGGGPCGVSPLPACEVCCDPDAAMEYVNTIGDSCGIRVMYG